MKKIYSLIISCVLLCCAGSAWGATSTVGANDAACSFSPVWGDKADKYVLGQMIYKSTELSFLSGKQITALTFYLRSSKSASKQWNNMNVRFIEATKTSFSSTTDWVDITGVTPVYSGTLDATGSTMVINLSSPYVYKGGDLIIDIRNSVKTNRAAAQFQASSASNCVLYDYNSSSSTPTSYTERISWRPKLMFTYEDAPSGGGSSCAKPTGVAASNVTYNSATITWTDDAASAWKLQYKVGSGAYQPLNGGATVSSKSFDMSDLTTGQVHYVQVKAVCGENDESEWSTAASFTPTCKVPSGLTVTETTATSASIDWTANSGETSWNIQYKTLSATSWTTLSDVSTKPYTITGLTAGKAYQVKVAGACGSSYCTAVDFETDCPASITIDDAEHPWVENFNDHKTGFVKDGAPHCWAILNANTNTTSTYPVIYINNGSYAQSGNALFFRSNASTGYVIFPAISTNLNTLQITFDHKEESATDGGFIVLGYMTNIADASTFNEIHACTPSTSWVTEDPIKFSSIPSGARLAFKYTGKSYYYDAGVDNITISLAPSCAIPTGLEESSITSSGATISWTSDASSFVLEYKTESGSWQEANNGSTISTTSYALGSNETLTENTLYYVRVKADCGGGSESEFTDGTFSFRTDCNPKAVTAGSPWQYGFEDAEATKMPYCWERVEAYANHGYPRAEASGGVSGDPKSLYFFCPGRSGFDPYTQTAILPTFNEEIKNLRIKFQYYNAATGTKYGYLEVGYVKDGVFTRVGDALAKLASPYNETEDIDMPSNAPNGARIALRCVGSTSGSTYSTNIYVDAIEVAIKPSCYTPTGLTAVANSTGAVVTWTDTEASKWNLRYSVKNADSWTILNNKTSGDAISGLIVGTTYEVQVQADCESDGTSAWSASAEFTPVCGAAPTGLTVTARTQTSATFDWTSDESAWKLQLSSDGGTSWGSAIDVDTKPYTLSSGLSAGNDYQVRVQNACGGGFATVSFRTWCGLADASATELLNEDFSSNAKPACWEANFVNEYSSFAGGTIFFYGTEEQWVAFPGFDINLDKLTVAFDYSVNGSKLQLGYLSTAGGAFTSLVTLPSAASKTHYEVDLATVSAPASKGYLALRYYDGVTNANIDDVIVRKTPTCAKPTGLAAGSITSSSASINWTSDADSWNLQYKTGSADWTTVAVSEKPHVLSGLAQGTTYKVRVQGNCSGDLSDWTDEAEFTTVCEAISAIPFTEGFGATLSNCWEITDDDPTNYYHYVSGGYLGLLGGKSASGHLIKLPEITADLSKATLSIRYKIDNTTGAAQPQVGYIDGVGEFQELAKLEKSNSFTIARIPLTGATSKLAIRYDDGTAEEDFLIDEIRVSHVEIFEDLDAFESGKDNESRLGSLSGLMDVVLTRTLFRDGDYITVCLPFALNATQLAEEKCPLNGFEIRQYNRSVVDLEGNQVDIYLQTVGEMEAGKAYFARYQGSAAELTENDFRDVTVTASETVDTYDAGSKIHFRGIFNPASLVKDDPKNLFLSKGSKLYYPDIDGYILMGFRGYMVIDEGSSALPVIRRGAKVRISEPQDAPTGVDKVQNDNVQCTKVLEGTQVIIIRNGVKYTIQGQKIQ